MTPVIDLRAVSRTFPGYPDVEALRPCDLQVASGELVAVVGPSGSGKSTLLNLLGLLDRPTSGTYRLEGTDVADLDEAERTSLRGRAIGFVFQSFELLDHRSSLENVMLAGLYSGTRRTARRQAATEALEAVGLSHRAGSAPVRMSGGERQRVAIARALSVRPRLLLCDEPTGNLDSGNATAILDLLVDLHRQGTTIVVITHDSQVAERCTRTVRIHDGVLTG